MKDRNFVKEIEKLRTAVLGYDREEVVLYIRELVEYYGQKNGEAVRELYLEKMQLAAENAGLRAQIPTQEKLYAEAEGKAEEILGLRLAVMHNLYFYNKLAQRIRDALDAGEFEAFRAEYSAKLSERV